jgi:hypothetical protein
VPDAHSRGVGQQLVHLIRWIWASATAPHLVGRVRFRERVGAPKLLSSLAGAETSRRSLGSIRRRTFGERRSWIFFHQRRDTIVAPSASLGQLHKRHLDRSFLEPPPQWHMDGFPRNALTSTRRAANLTPDEVTGSHQAGEVHRVKRSPPFSTAPPPAVINHFPGHS